MSALNVRPFSKRHSVKINGERYRSGHNGADSKSNAWFGSVGLKNLDTAGFLPCKSKQNTVSSLHQFSPMCKPLRIDVEDRYGEVSKWS